jgi:hypothetical protein
MTTKPKTRKAPVKPAASKPDPWGMKLDADGPSQAIVEAEDIPSVARKLTGAIYIMATDLNEYECGAICAMVSGAVPRNRARPGTILKSRELVPWQTAAEPGRASACAVTRRKQGGDFPWARHLPFGKFKI